MAAPVPVLLWSGSNDGGGFSERANSSDPDFETVGNDTCLLIESLLTQVFADAIL